MTMHVGVDVIPMVDDRGVWHCAACQQSVGASTGWSSETAVVSRPAVSQLARYGVKVRERGAGHDVVLQEHYCRGCGTQVHAEVLVRP